MNPLRESFELASKCFQLMSIPEQVIALCIFAKYVRDKGNDKTIADKWIDAVHKVVRPTAELIAQMEEERKNGPTKF